jgi:uncharacterized protein with von Willebrand factor type A (vWA) domain
MKRLPDFMAQAGAEEMFIDFFYSLREQGVPVSPTAFLTLNRALAKGLIENLDDFYIAARSILIKSERYFDLYDQIFASQLAGTPLPANKEPILDEIVLLLLQQWLQNPGASALLPDLDAESLQRLSVEELLAYFKARLQEQKGEHHGGSKWIGTGGASPSGHSGYHPTPMRVAGDSSHRSALQVAAQRRYRDYSGRGPLNQARIGEALKRLRKLVPAGAKDRISIADTISRTVKIGGEIEIVFKQSLKDRLKVIIVIDNGGWSMEPHVKVVQTLFDYSRTQFKDLRTYFFHNTIYDNLWQDHARSKKPFLIDRFAGFDPESRLIVVGDASMAPYELSSRDGSIHIRERSDRTSFECLEFLVKTFPHSVWLNPIQEKMWSRSRTITMIQQIFPMFELSLDGLEKAVSHLVE